MTTRQEVVAEGRSWLLTPYKHQASLKGIGADCIGFIAGVGLALGLPGIEEFRNDPAFKGYGRDPDPRLMEQACERYLDPIPFDQAGLGDILRMCFQHDPRHFAMITALDPTYIIHAYSMLSLNLSRVVEHGLGPVWRARVDKAYRLRGIE